MRKISAGRDAHPEELEVACLRALSDGRIDDAFRSIDRRCRISPLPRAHHFVLRAETLSQMGDGRGAMADITHALELAPEDIQANRRMLAWGDGEAQRDAAQRLIGLDPDPAVLIDAMNVLRRAGARAIASLRAFDDIIAGWVAWDGDGKVELHISGAQGRTRSTSCPRISTRWCAANSPKWPASNLIARAPRSPKLSVYRTREKGSTQFEPSATILRRPLRISTRRTCREVEEHGLRIRRARQHNDHRSDLSQRRSDADLPGVPKSSDGQDIQLPGDPGR